MTTTDLDTLSINTIRGLCMDAVQKANSGHPGTPMGIAPVAYTLWQRFLRFDPADPIWPNRDRFVLSEGHASTLLWSLLHLTGVQAVDPDYEVLGTAGGHHGRPEDVPPARLALPGPPRVPLDQRRRGHDRAARPGRRDVGRHGHRRASGWPPATTATDSTLFDFDVYALAGDGCMMEGISSEAASLAGHLELSNLCWIYDSNRVTIEGHTDIAFTEDVAARFIAYGWNVTTVADANDLESVARALHTFQAEHERPTLIARAQPHRLRLAGRGLAQGARRAPRRRRRSGPPSASSACPRTRTSTSPTGSTTGSPTGIGARGRDARTAWEATFERYRDAATRSWPTRSSRCSAATLPDGWEAALPDVPARRRRASPPATPPGRC